MRPGIKPTSSWILVGLVTAEPQQELKALVFLGFFFFCFLWLHLQHMEVLRLGVKSELQLLAYTTAIATWDPELHLLAYSTATATWDPSRNCDLLCSSWQGQILNPLREARDPTRILMDTSWAHYHNGNFQQIHFHS